MEKPFIVRYRGALRELQEAYKLQCSLIDESDVLRTLAYQQEQTAEKAILKNRKTGRGFLISQLRECLDEEHHAWAITQHLRRGIEEKEVAGYDSEVSHEQNHNLYLVISDAIGWLLDLLGSQFPKKLTGTVIATYRGNVRVSELILRFGSGHLQRIVRQQLQAVTQPLDTRTPDAGAVAPTVDDPATEWKSLLKKGVRFTLDDLDALLVNVKLLNDAASRTPEPEFKGTAIVGVIEALRERVYLIRKNNAKLARVLAKRYGAEHANNHSVGRSYDPPVPDLAHPFYTRALAFLPAG